MPDLVVTSSPSCRSTPGSGRPWGRSTPAGSPFPAEACVRPRWPPRGHRITPVATG